ncbi:nitroreductase family deazaflavin-dependent oxidoreductase [Actinoallomurus purpureus]|uniref:nitroreductase family deazaflavin-dependent oxidoreductase n=1 Tax=Actinoallomurus purpureus TaxID=478114 RepID=UPI002093712C|nr:nitroreductase family deazaflavin-dependent oxidoreductase [Actinoallomurus purpureus]MCO6004928.1 nitroreductase family deazaflavin-dependent oxidoreductase [Actinoallomurus purpureus]
MRVLVTGGSGFVGSYTVRALLAAGHHVRVLVRDPGRAVEILGAIGVEAEAVEMHPGDMLDEEAVAQALDGCDAVVHAAAALGVTDTRTDVLEVNVAGTRAVVGGAVARGLDPVIHVSTIAVFVPPAGPMIRAEDPLAHPRTDYGRSKVAAERYVRGLQADGAPITIVYPGGVIGPRQPRLDAMMEGLAGALNMIWPMPSGGVSLVDVRDLGEALARAVVPGRGPRRYTLGGHYLTWPGLADHCDALTGVRCRRVVVPGGLMIALGSLLDAAKRVRSFDYPLTRDAAQFMVTLVPSDDTAAIDALGVTLRPVEESLADALRWLAAAGHLSPARAGRLAPPRPVRAGPGRIPDDSVPGGAEGVPGRTDPPERTGGAPDREAGQVMPRSRLQAAITPTVQRVSGSPWFAKIAPKIVPPLDRALHRLSGGRLLMGQYVVPSLVLKATGHRSGLPRQTPLACLPEPDGSYVVVGSNFGRENHPAWTTNLLHDPSAEVSHRGRTIPVTARLLEGAERAEVWPRLLKAWPTYDTYVERSGRELRVFRLQPRG